MTGYHTDDPLEQALVWHLYADGTAEMDRDATPRDAQDWYERQSHHDREQILWAASDRAEDDAEWDRGMEGLDRLERRGLI
jgi:hypothetical protein